MIAASLAGHLVHELRRRPRRPPPNRPWRLDPVPLVLDGRCSPSWPPPSPSACVGDGGAAGRPLRASAVRQARAGCRPRRWRPRPRYRLAAVGAPPPVRWLTTYAVDVLRLADGSWRVVQDLADTPTGVGYALLDRSVMARVAAELLGPQAAGDLASISGFPSELRHALAGAARRRQPAHRAVLGRDRRSGVRRALVAGPAARLPPRRGARPRRAHAAACGCARWVGSSRSTSSTVAWLMRRWTRSR